MIETSKIYEMYSGGGFLDDEAEVIINYLDNILVYPPILEEATHQTNHGNDIYDTTLQLLRPFSEYGVNSGSLKKLDLNAMWMQAISWQNKDEIALRGILTNYTQESANQKLLSVSISRINNHSSLAGCMICANKKEKDIYSLFSEGIPLLDINNVSIKLEFEATPGGREIVFVAIPFFPLLQEFNIIDIETECQKLISAIIPGLKSLVQKHYPDLAFNKRKATLVIV